MDHFIYVVVKDVYKATMQSDGALVAEVTPGAVVNVTDTKGTYTTAVSNSDVAGSTGVFVRIDEKTKGAGWKGTATISYNGTVIATKSGTISGDVSKITVTPYVVGDAGTGKGSATADAFGFQAYDAAGNVVQLTTGGTKADDALKFDSSSDKSVIAAAVSTTANTTAPKSGKGTITCSAAGKADVTLYYVNEAGTIVKSNAASFLCGGDADSYTASWDKASYKQGDIAKLTVKFLDAKGNAANSIAQVSKSDTGDQVITAPQMVRVTEAAAFAAAATVDETGAITYTYTVGTDSGVTPGSYNAVVSFPYVNTGGTGAGHGANQAASYTITSGGTSISNAEVLAAIVKLIASINKQITALQKLLTKKK